jgi:hypothetical protein
VSGQQHALAPGKTQYPLYRRLEKERKTKTKLEKDCFGGSRKMGQNME